jgi:molybdenum cofactor biosynthesis enzyme MoaA
MRLSYKQIISVAEEWLSLGGQAKVEVAALEPLLWAEDKLRISDVVNALKNIGYVVSITTNGSLLENHAESLKKANLDLVRLSWHSINAVDYKEITGGGSLHCFMTGLEKAIEVGLNISINRVLLAGFTQDITEQVRFIDNHKIRLKLLDLYWTPSNAVFFDKYYLNPKDVIDALELEKNFLQPVDFANQGTRSRVQFKTPNGGKIEYKLSSTAKKKHSVCYGCDKKDFCLEGYADYFRVFPEGTGSLCYLRKELAVHIFDDNKANLIKFAEYCNSEELVIKQIPLRLVLEGRCNFNCGFPKSNDSWCLKYDLGYKFPIRKVTYE